MIWGQSSNWKYKIYFFGNGTSIALYYFTIISYAFFSCPNLKWVNIYESRYKEYVFLVFLRFYFPYYSSLIDEKNSVMTSNSKVVKALTNIKAKFEKMTPFTLWRQKIKLYTIKFRLLHTSTRKCSKWIYWNR